MAFADRKMTPKELKELSSLYTMDEMLYFLDIFWEKAHMEASYLRVSKSKSVRQIVKNLNASRFYFSSTKLRPLGVDSPGVMLKVLLTKFKDIPIKLNEKNLLVREAYAWRLKIGK